MDTGKRSVLSESILATYFVWAPIGIATYHETASAQIGASQDDDNERERENQSSNHAEKAGSVFVILLIS
jgi:hypothetical protein